jgi:hypothetical protein
MFDFVKVIWVVGVYVVMSTGCSQDQSSKAANLQTASRKSGPVDPAAVSSQAPADEGRFPPGPTRPAPTIQLEPIDLTTSTGQTPLQVLVSNLGGPVGMGPLNQIARSVTLRAWPEQTVVAVSVSKIVDATGNSDEDEFAHIYLTPSSPLADRWYALSVDALPQGISWPAFANVLDVKGGARVSRFRVGSGPVVTGVRVYAKDPTRHLVYVDFSERVAGDMKLVNVSYGGGGAPGCQPDSARPPASSPGASSGISAPAGAPADTSVTSVRLTCGIIDMQRALQIDIPPGFRSTSGPALNAGSPLRHVVNPADWVDWGQGGKLFRPSSP